MIKELRFWNEMLTLDSLNRNRYHQIDPTSNENRALLVYFRMGTGNAHLLDFALYSRTAKNKMD